MRKDLNYLVLLQKVDAELSGTNLRKKELPNKINSMDEAFRIMNEKVESERKRLDELVQTHRAKEDALKKGGENLKKTKERLLEVKTNKEYQAMLKEIEGIGEKNSEIEDGIIFFLDEIDAAKGGLKNAESELENFRTTYEKDKKEIEKELGLIGSEVARLIKEMEDIRGEINSEILERYDKIKKHRNGSAVVSVWKGVCEGCHMNLPPQMYNEVQRLEDIMQCPFCSRIIYWNDKGKNA